MPSETPSAVASAAYITAPSAAPEADGPRETLIFRLRKAMPAPAKRVFQAVKAVRALIGGAVYDALRFARYSGALDKSGTRETVNADITKYYHMIEKGLALPVPRPGFGRIAIRDLCVKVTKAIHSGYVDPEICHAIDALAGYRAFNDAHGIANPAWIGDVLALATERGIAPSASPVRQPSARPEIDPDTLIGFIASRHSVRQFAANSISRAALESAALAARSAPCVCNRQASRIYFAQDPAMRKALLACQNGNRGFGDAAPVVAVVTVDLRNFLDAGERYQAWIDGGLFAMNLLLGLHAQGIGACCLNWSALPAQDRALRRLGIIPPHETVIMMIAAGIPAEGGSVARSERPALDTVVRFI